MNKLYLLLFLAIPGAAAVGTDPAGVKNFHQVDQNLYRGAQPTEEGLRNLAALGVKTIVDLRHGKEQADGEEKAAEALGLKYISVPMQGLDAPTDRQVAVLLKVLNAAEQGPVFVHCREGRDRTGAVIACYRIEHDHWSNDQALAEAKEYGLHPAQHPREKFILNFVPPMM